MVKVATSRVAAKSIAPWAPKSMPPRAPQRPKAPQNMQKPGEKKGGYYSGGGWGLKDCLEDERRNRGKNIFEMILGGKREPWFDGRRCWGFVVRFMSLFPHGRRFRGFSQICCSSTTPTAVACIAPPALPHSQTTSPRPPNGQDRPLPRPNPRPPCPQISLFNTSRSACTASGVVPGKKVYANQITSYQLA